MFMLRSVRTSITLRKYTEKVRLLVAKRAETRPCPVCEELIPIRLLGHHAELELSRLDTIIQRIGSTEVLADSVQDVDAGRAELLVSYLIVYLPILLVDVRRVATNTRRSAIKARKAINPRSAWATDAASSLSTAEKTIRAIKRRRKSRNAMLRDQGAEDEEYTPLRAVLARGVDEDGNAGKVCPVCSQVVRGDQDVIDAHVDSCLAHADRMREERELAEADAAAIAAEEVDVGGEDDGWEEVEVDGDVRLRRTSSVTLRGKVVIYCSQQTNRTCY